MSTLAKQIIFGSTNDVAAYIKRGATLNEIDEYGYTPLIQAAIVNSVPKAKLILEAGADVNFTDLTGRTALHWAVDNNNLELSNLLISQGANSNAYTRAGQPVLAMPVLRAQSSIKQLLYQHAADLNFAQDFINAKLLGHRFELEGRVDILDNKGTFIEVEFEGFYLEFSLAIVAESLIDFKNNYGGKHLRNFFPQLQSIIIALQNGAELIKYQHYLVEIKEHEKRIDSLLNANPLLIPVAYSGHAISLIKYDDWLIRCDRGAFGRDNGTVIFYKMGEPHNLNKALIKNLLYKRQGKEFIDEGLTQLLKLKPIGQLPLSVQISGNCSWANIEAVIPTMMFLLLLQEQRSQEVVGIEDCKKKALYFYEQWLEWDKNRALYFCINSFYHSTPARKATKAAILAAILFQQCEYFRSQDREKAEKILPILTIPEYRYILKSYFQVFNPVQNNKQIKNLAEFIDEFGIDLQDFLH
ncbi:MAG: ankyrin repeat domain-containing protein [Gammaproteobacteria bacterium]|nr:ankyrin repeat domain-containing protein [Gammaproteobacteria bacterium]